MENPVKFTTFINPFAGKSGYCLTAGDSFISVSPQPYTNYLFGVMIGSESNRIDAFAEEFLTADEVSERVNTWLSNNNVMATEQ